MKQFQTHKNNFSQKRLVESKQDDLSIADDEILLKIDRFAFTANNITYAVTGFMLGYWQFFPAIGEEAKDWGVIPVWGFADVIKSNVDGIPVGERLFGYFSPSDFLKMKPVKISPKRFIDGSAHRSKLPAGYNNYTRVNAEPNYNKSMDNLRMLLWPLHMTSFCLWDALKVKDWYGAEQVIVISASSKTSVGLGYALKGDEDAPKSIGITSDRNVDFVKGLDLYNNTITYDSISEIDASIPTVLVDMSGNIQVLKSLYQHLGDNRKYCINVGLTHWEKGGQDKMLAERSEFFFAPSHMQMRAKEWGPDGLQQRTSKFIMETAAACQKWLEFKTLDGLVGLDEIYNEVCDGRIPANHGLIVEM